MADLTTVLDDGKLLEGGNLWDGALQINGQAHTATIKFTPNERIEIEVVNRFLKEYYLQEPWSHLEGLVRPSILQDPSRMPLIHAIAKYIMFMPSEQDPARKVLALVDPATLLTARPVPKPRAASPEPSSRPGTHESSRPTTSPPPARMSDVEREFDSWGTPLGTVEVNHVPHRMRFQVDDASTFTFHGYDDLDKFVTIDVPADEWRPELAKEPGLLENYDDLSVANAIIARLQYVKANNDSRRRRLAFVPKGERPPPMVRKKTQTAGDSQVGFGNRTVIGIKPAAVAVNGVVRWLNTHAQKHRAAWRWKLARENIDIVLHSDARLHLVHDGRSKFERGLWLGAAALFQSAMDADAKAMVAEPARFHRMAARAQYRAYMQTCEEVYLQQAYESYRQAITHISNLSSPDVLMEVGMVFVRFGSWKGAAQMLGTIIQDHPRFDALNEAVFQASMVLLRMGQHAQAISYLTAVLTNPPSLYREEHLMFGLLVMYLSSGNHAMATATLQDVYSKFHSRNSAFTRGRNKNTKPPSYIKPTRRYVVQGRLMEGTPHMVKAMIRADAAMAAGIGSELSMEQWGRAFKTWYSAAQLFLARRDPLMAYALFLQADSFAKAGDRTLDYYLDFLHAAFHAVDKQRAAALLDEAVKLAPEGHADIQHWQVVLNPAAYGGARTPVEPDSLLDAQSRERESRHARLIEAGGLYGVAAVRIQSISRGIRARAEVAQLRESRGLPPMSPKSPTRSGAVSPRSFAETKGEEAPSPTKATADRQTAAEKRAADKRAAEKAAAEKAAAEKAAAEQKAADEAAAAKKAAADKAKAEARAAAERRNAEQSARNAAIAAQKAAEEEARRKAEADEAARQAKRRAETEAWRQDHLQREAQRKKDDKRRNDAAIKIQSMVRGRLARKRVAEIRRKRAAATAVSRQWEAEEAAKLAELERRRAAKLAELEEKRRKAEAARAAREAAENAAAEERRAAELVAAAAQREEAARQALLEAQSMAQRQIEEMRRKNDERQAALHAAATRIESVVRGFLARRRVKRIRAQREEAKQAKLAAAAHAERLAAMRARMQLAVNERAEELAAEMAFPEANILAAAALLSQTIEPAPTVESLRSQSPKNHLSLNTSPLGRSNRAVLLPAPVPRRTSPKASRPASPQRLTVIPNTARQNASVVSSATSRPSSPEAQALPSSPSASLTAARALPFLETNVVGATNTRNGAITRSRHAGYAGSHTRPYMQHWRALLSAAAKKFASEVDLHRSLSQILSTHTKLNRLEAFVGLASCGCDVRLAKARLLDTSVQEEVANVCRIVDVAAYMKCIGTGVPPPGRDEEDATVGRSASTPIGRPGSPDYAASMPVSPAAAQTPGPRPHSRMLSSQSSTGSLPLVAPARERAASPPAPPMATRAVGTKLEQIDPRQRAAINRLTSKVHKCNRANCIECQIANLSKGVASP